ncbi:MAG: hypothetical protein H7A35_05585 [Planctomycetales bacterium]|nr:hypothetical protein [bacterium]UNM09530.1 MAG: hypothetical protein H7A35_05585 [Planctomycetales bacterium]
MHTGTMLRELTRLKFRLTIRHYRKNIGNTIAIIFAWIGMTIGALSGAAAVGVFLFNSGGDVLQQAGRIMVWVSWILSLIWLFSPFAQVDIQRNLDLNGLRLMPLSGSQFLLAVMMDALASPLGVILLPAMLLFVGVLAFAGLGLVPMLVSFVLLLAILLAWTQAIFLLVNRLLQSRRFAEMSMWIGITLVIGVQIVNLTMVGGVDDISGQLASSPLQRWIEPVMAAMDYSFPTLATRATTAWSTGQPLAALLDWGLMLVWLAPGVFLLGRTSRAFYEGELESGGLAEEHGRADRSQGIAGLLPGGVLQALVQREQRYVKRDPVLRSLLIQSLFFGIYTCVVMVVLRMRLLEEGAPGMDHHGIVNYVLLGLSFGLTYSESGIMFNRFGYEGSSLATVLASPLSRRSLLQAKSIFLLSHLGVVNLLLVLAMGVILRCDPMYVAAAMAMIIANIVIVDMAGNFLSISHPFAFARVGRRYRPVLPQQGCGYLLLYGLLFNFCNLLVAPGSMAIVLGTVFYGLPGLLGGVLLAWAIAAGLWLFGLGQAVNFLEGREQRLLESLSRPPD